MPILVTTLSSSPNPTMSQPNNYTDRAATTGTVTNFPDVVLQDDIASANAIVRSIDATDGTVSIAISNTRRRGYIIFNGSSCEFLIKYGSMASELSFTDSVQPGERWVMPFPIYTGLLTGIFISPTGHYQRVSPGIVNGSVMTTELYTN